MELVQTIDITKKGAEMIITENREKVKRKAIRLVNKLSDVLTKPERKFVLEMIMGILITEQ